ncbi:unnamed protein product [Mytilus edulis]|uniref:Uncharacterized protein n=1 Tax=Mytilus edulis TaxID=6550 RepID=A0A8S3QRS6_MYTED|nr:unnamed protein product [Mytilus edulis]
MSNYDVNTLGLKEARWNQSGVLTLVNRVTVLLKTGKGVIRTKMNSQLAAIVLDPNGDPNTKQLIKDAVIKQMDSEHVESKECNNNILSSSGSTCNNTLLNIQPEPGPSNCDWNVNTQAGPAPKKLNIQSGPSQTQETNTSFNNLSSDESALLNLDLDLASIVSKWCNDPFTVAPTSSSVANEEGCIINFFGSSLNGEHGVTSIVGRDSKDLYESGSIGAPQETPDTINGEHTFRNKAAREEETSGTSYNSEQSSNYPVSSDEGTGC